MIYLNYSSLCIVGLVIKKIVCDFKRCSSKTIMMPGEATSVLNWMLEEILIALFYAREKEKGFL
jgi:hypothetical protein